MRLEAYQLAESILLVSAKREIKENNKKNKKAKLKQKTKEKQDKKSYNSFEYLILFDHSLGLRLLWFDYESIKRLSDMRMELLPWFGAPPAQFSPNQTTHLSSPKRTPSVYNSSQPETRGRTFKVLPFETSSPTKKTHPGNKANRSTEHTSNKPPLAQISNLLDEKLLGRNINFSIYEMCHHCKQLKPISSHLIKCCYSSYKYGPAIPSFITIKGVKLYNGIHIYIYTEIY